MGEGGNGSSIWRYHGADSAEVGGGGARASEDEVEDDSDTCRDWRKGAKWPNFRANWGLGVESRDLDVWAGIDTAASEANASRTEMRHDVHRTMDRCISLDV
jgi:hypothetical protein